MINLKSRAWLHWKGCCIISKQFCLALHSPTIWIQSLLGAFIALTQQGRYLVNRTSLSRATLTQTYWTPCVSGESLSHGQRGWHYWKESENQSASPLRLAWSPGFRLMPEPEALTHAVCSIPPSSAAQSYLLQSRKRTPWIQLWPAYRSPLRQHCLRSWFQQFPCFLCVL